MIETNKFKGWLWPLASFAVGAWVLMGPGCGAKPPAGRINAPPQGYAGRIHKLHKHFTAMTSNAAIIDMSVSSTHFIYRTAKLNSLGVYRLKMLAATLAEHGGEVHYDGTEADEALQKERLSQIEEFLLASGLDQKQFDVKIGLPGGTGMSAAEAIASRDSVDEGSKASGTSSPGFNIFNIGGGGE